MIRVRVRRLPAASGLPLPAAASAGSSGCDLRAALAGEAVLRPGERLLVPTGLALEIPPGVPFDQPEQTAITWEVALNADELIGLLGTFSWVILLEDDARARLLETARRALRDMLGVSGDVTVDMPYRAEVWKARRHD